MLTRSQHVVILPWLRVQESEHKQALASQSQPAIRYCLAVLLLPLLAVPAFIALGKSDFFLHHGASFWVRSNDAVFAMRDRHCDVVVFGDSTAMTGIDPAVVENETGLRTCNISVTNAVMAVTGNLTLDSFLARVIPARDVPTRNSPLSEPPESLLLALRIFMVGVAAGLSQNGNVGNRSMLVHPSQLTIQHQEFYSWVRDIFEEWKRVLNLDDSELDKQDLLEEFRLAYDDLRQTVDDLPEFEALRPLFRLAFRNTTLLQVNASGGRTPKVEWGHPMWC